ncbi:meiotic recombination protein REC8 homolog isoform X2 [Stegodyphus dumicola]|uniref:meiotic recombination protein REC8 homolog isoform X2 n=1 Tax=Stegodyphus dumicola TaxID=202533 RepID=UPI0015AA7114|nr:meiotic recombination protein REC8 homolog isoform X2 [Stegodyphus dumicola]
MLYSHDILQKRGKFGIIWLAATAVKRLKKKEVCGVNVAKSCEDILNIIHGRIYFEGQRRAYLSLLVSSQLMYGLVFINNRQFNFLLEEIKALVSMMAEFGKKKVLDIDLPDKCLSKFRVTFKEPDMENVPPEFGCLKEVSFNGVEYPSYEYFTITTPRSTDEWVVSPGYPEQYRAPDIEELERAHLARREDITMLEPSTDEAAATLEPQRELEDVPGILDLPEMGIFQEPSPSEEKPAIEGEAPVSHLLMTPEIPVDMAEPTAPRKPAETDQFMDTTVQLTSPAPRRRRALFEETNGEFILKPVTISPRARRRRHLIVDQQTTLSREEMEANIETANRRLTNPFQYASLQEPVEAMFRRFGSRTAARGRKNFWCQPKTLQEPDDPAPFGNLMEELEVLEEAEPILEESIAVEMIGGESEMERERAAESYSREAIEPSVSGLPSLLKGPEGISAASYLAKDSSSLPSLGKEFQKYEPVPAESVEFPTDEMLEKLRESVPQCIVSPERTPPPPSPEEPAWPFIEETLNLVKQTFQESPISELTNFAAVLEKTERTRKCVARMFSHLLHLHANEIIRLEQPVPGRDIFIFKGRNYENY